MRERAAAWAYLLGWKLVCRVPRRWAEWAFRLFADWVWWRHGPRVRQLGGEPGPGDPGRAPGPARCSGYRPAAAVAAGRTVLSAVLAGGIPAAGDTRRGDPGPHAVHGRGGDRLRLYGRRARRDLRAAAHGQLGG